MSIYNNKHVVFEQVGVDSDTVVRNQSSNTDGDGAYNNYEISNIRNTVLPTKALALSSELYATLTNTTVQTAKNGTSTSLVSTSDKTFILAQKEMVTNEVYSVQQEFDALITLNYYVNHTTGADRKKYDRGYTVRPYWLRSPKKNQTGTTVVISAGGSLDTYWSHDTQCLSQCFAY